MTFVTLSRVCVRVCGFCHLFGVCVRACVWPWLPERVVVVHIPCVNNTSLHTYWTACAKTALCLGGRLPRPGCRQPSV